jgi:hypothetical protein
MSDDQTVDTGSESSGEQAAETTEQSETTATEATAETTEQSAETAQDAGGAAEGTPDPNESRTGFVTNARQGDECICPDGRKGTVHKFDEGLVCIPNADQG